MTSSYHLEDRGKCNKNACANVRNVPQLRFKGYNDEWKHLNLKSITKMIKDGTHGSYNDLSEGIPLLSAKDIENGKVIIPDDCRKISISDYNDIYKNYFLEIDDILLTIVGTIGRVAIVSDLTNKYAFQRSVGILRANEHNSPNFILYLLQTDFIKKQFYSKVNQSAQGGIYLDTLGKIDFKIPTKKEQEKIASFLTLIDKKIEKQKELVEILKKYKRGLLSAIFSQKMRFKDDNGKDYPVWEEKYIQDVCLITTGKGNTQDKEENGIYPFYVRSPIIEKSNKYLFDGEAVLTVGDGVGTGKVFHYVNGKFNFHQRVYKMSNFSGINGKYFYYYFSTYFYDRVKRMTAKTSVDSVRMDMIAKMPIFIPTNEEQDKILNLLTNVENIFLKNENQLLLLQEYKKGLLQQMFI